MSCEECDQGRILFKSHKEESMLQAE